jgi:hypothetical protein
MNWLKKTQLKEEHRMREEWECVCEPEPPQGGDATLPISPYTGEPYDPEWGAQFLPLLYRADAMPRARVDPKLVGRDQQ